MYSIIVLRHVLLDFEFFIDSNSVITISKVYFRILWAIPCCIRKIHVLCIGTYSVGARTRDAVKVTVLTNSFLHMRTTMRHSYSCSESLREFENTFQRYLNLDSSDFDDLYDLIDTFEDEYEGQDYFNSDEYFYQYSSGFISCLDVDFYIYTDEFENFDMCEQYQHFLDVYGERVFQRLMRNEYTYECVHELDDDLMCFECSQINVALWSVSCCAVLRMFDTIERDLGIVYEHPAIPVTEEFFDALHDTGLLNQLFMVGTRKRILLLLSGDVESNPGPVFSRPEFPCNNNLKGVLLEKEMNRIVKRLISKLRTLERDAVIEPQGFSSIPDNIKNINDFLDHALPLLQNNLTSSMGSFLNGLHVIKEDLVKLTVFVLLVVLLLRVSAYKSAIVSMVIFLCHHYGFPNEIMAICSELKGQNITVQGFDDIVYDPIFVLSGKLLFVISSFIVIKSLPGRKDMDSFLVRLDRIPKAKDGADKIMTHAVDLWNLVHEQIKMLVLGKTRAELRMVNEVYQKIDEWAKNIRKFVELEERNRIDSDLETANFVEQLYIQGLEFQKECNLSREAQRVISTHMLPAKHLYEYVSLSPVKGGGPRMKPVCIWLIGSSGVGKTEMVYPLCIDLLRKMGILGKQAFHHQVYPRQVETEFFDGYNQQKIVIYDDAFQKKDDKINGNLEIFEVIRSCNTFPQHLHMAAIQEKNTFSKAEVLIYTTNQANVSLESITHPEAFYNRMYENAYVVRPKDEYAIITRDVTGKKIYTLDHSKIVSDKAIDLDIYCFQKVIHSQHGIFDYSGDEIDFVEFSKMMCNQWAERKEKSVAKLQFLEDYAIRPQGFWEFKNKYIDSWFDSSSDDYSFSYFDNFICERLQRGLSLQQIEYELALDDVKFDYYVRYKKRVKPSIWTSFGANCDSCYVHFKGFLERGVQECERILSENQFVRYIGVISVALSGVLLGVWAMNTILKDEDSDSSDGVMESNVSVGDGSRIYHKVRPELLDSSDPRGKKLVRVKVESQSSDQAACRLRNLVQSQGCSDEVSHNLMVSLVRKNTYRLTFILNGVEKHMGNVTFIKGWSMVMPYHYLIHMHMCGVQLHDILYLSQDNLPHVIQFPFSHVIDSVVSEVDELCGNFLLTKHAVLLKYSDGSKIDCVLVNLHKQMCHIHRDILKHFVCKLDQSYLVGRVQGAYVTYQKEKDGAIVRTYQWMNNIHPNDEIIEVVFPGQDSTQLVKSYIQRETYSYNAPTNRGDCGSIIGVYNHRLSRKLIGMHIAGDNKNSGYAIPLYQERIQEALDQFPITCQMYYECDQQIDDKLDVCLPKGQFIALGKIGVSVGQNSRTSLIKSKIYNRLQISIMKPAILKPVKVDGILVNPLDLGLEKCGGLPICLDNRVLRECVLDVKRLILTQFNESVDISVYRRVLTYDESICGADDEFMRAVCRSTSPGFPYLFSTGGFPGKTRWLGSRMDYDLSSNYALSLRGDVELLISNCAKGVITGVYCVDTLKDEKRLIEKVDKGKTRVFSACPQHFVIAFRKFFLGFAAWVMHNRIDNEIALGTNVYSYDWHRIAKRMSLKGNAVVAGDFTNFDGSLNTQVLWRILDIINEWYDDGPTNKLVRTGLWCHIVNSVHIKGDNIYMWTHSQPSGNPFTTIINSLYNSIIKRMAWYYIMEPQDMANMVYFNKYVSFISYGDDDIINISSTVLPYFNQHSLSTQLLKLGHIYTDESKKGKKIVDYRSLSEVVFLKRSFRFCEELQRFVAPLQKEIIYEMLNWTRNDVDPDEVMMTNIECAAREFVLHGFEQYNRYLFELRQVRDLLPRQPMIGSYCQYLLDIEAGEGHWVDLP
nr:MAG: hypothetical protein 1 [Dicistroviridae sp.]